MADAFNFARTPYIYFGAGKFTLVPNLIKGYIGKTVLILTGKSSFIKTPHWKELTSLLSLHGIRWYHATVSGQPSPRSVNILNNRFQDEHIEGIVAIGGGSVIDMGKALTFMYYCEDGVENYLEKVGAKMPDGRSLPFLAIPTTSGTGSETTNYAQITKSGVNGFRDKLSHYHFMPEIAVIDPRLMVSCPPKLTATMGLAAFTQLLEPFLSLGGNQLTDSFAFKGLTHISKDLTKVYKDGTDIKARSGMAYAAMASGIALSNAGHGTVQGLANAIAARFNIPHRVLCAILIGKVNELTIQQLKKYAPQNPALHKYAQVGRLFHRSRGKNDEYYRTAFLDKLKKWNTLFEIPTLSDYGVTQSSIAELIPLVDNGNNPMPLWGEHFTEILESCL